MEASRCCVLCGVACSPDRFRFTPVQSVQALLSRRCIPTGFHFGLVMAQPREGRCVICFHCINWRRRSRRVLLTPRLVHTPFDSVLMFALAPGHAEDPDSRCFPRLARTVLDPSNGFAALVPDPARVILASVVGGTQKLRLETGLRAWWDLNERTPFFRHPGTSRAIRRLLTRSI
jgi:hypothetical protein